MRATEAGWAENIQPLRLDAQLIATVFSKRLLNYPWVAKVPQEGARATPKKNSLNIRVKLIFLVNLKNKLCVDTSALVGAPTILQQFESFGQNYVSIPQPTRGAPTISRSFIRSRKVQ